MKKTKITTMIAVVCTALILLVGGTFAWYYDSNKVNLNQIDGAVTYLTKYFESGDGTGPEHAKYNEEGNIVSEEGCAYEIKTAEQFYNLAWLQYMGYFNQPEEGGTAIPTTYFYLSADIDMTGYVLPPIGTSVNPFLGNFDGCGHSVSGLTVTNKVNGSGTSIKDLPYTLVIDDVNEVENVEIIGLFGVVGTLDKATIGNESNATFGSYTYSSITNKVQNLYISGLTVETQTSDSLIGVAVGYVNGTVENVGVIDSNIKIDGTVTALSYTSNLSDYSLVGYCTEAYKDTVDVVYVDQAAPVVKLSKFQNQDSGDAWGGSISMEDLYTRLSGMYDQAQPVTYSTEKTVVIDIDGNRTVTENVTTAQNNNIISYDDSSINSETNAGRVTFSKRSTGDKSFVLLYGEKEIPYSKTVTTTQTKLVAYEGTYISNGTYYLTANGSGITNGVTLSQSSSVWDITSEDGYIFTYIDNTKYYLNRNNNDLSISQTPDTIWSKASNFIYCDSVEIKYYLACSDAGEWSLSPQTKYYYITDGTNYLVCSNGVFTNTQTEAEATHWSFTSSGTGYRISYSDGNTTYYLGYNNRLDANTETTWYIDEKGIYCQNNGTNYYLLFDNESWNAEPEQYTISSGDSYLSVQNGDITTTDQSNASLWTYSNNYLSTVSNETTYYLNLSRSWDNTSLTISTGGNTSWYIDSSGYCYTKSWRTYYYIYLNGSTWSLTPSKNVTRAVIEKYINGSLASRQEGKMEAATTVELENENGTYEQTTTTTINEDSSYLTPDSFVPLAADTKDGYGVQRNNTGYIISGAQYTDSNYANSANSNYLMNSGDIRVSSDFFNFSHLYYSNNNASDKKYSAQGGTNLEIVTITAQSGGKYVRIKDNYNKNNTSVNTTLSKQYSQKIDYTTLGLKKYEDSRDILHSHLNASKTGYLYGLHFMDAEISVDNVVTIPHAVINDEDYYDFKMPRDCIDFTLKEAGFINFFAGSYFTNNNTFFSLHQIFRDENGDITAIRQISKIYDLGNETYAYLFADSVNNICSDGKTHDDSELIFDLKWIMEPDLGTCVGTSSNGYKGALYYFEVPANAGEYALGSVDGRIGAYLIYLDISANSQEVQCQEITEVTTTTTNTYEYPKGLQVVTSTDSKPIVDTNSVAVALNDDNQTVEIKRENDTVTFSGAGTAVYKGDDLTLKDSGGNAMTVFPKSTVVVTEKKITRIEYNTTTKVTKTTITTITETTENGALKDRTYKVTVDGVEQAATDDDTSVAGGTGILDYHYILPKETTVVNTFDLPQLEANGLTTIVDTDYPQIGEEAVEFEDKATAYTVTVSTTKDISIKEDTISDGYTATLNGNTFTAGQSISVSPE